VDGRICFGDAQRPPSFCPEFPALIADNRLE
jgi:hypothetical protein